MKVRNMDEVLTGLLDLGGKRVLDVGCGTGGLVRLMTRLGARVSGLDPNTGQLEEALAAAAAGDETYIEGVAEDLPFPPASMDIVVFSNSLHHVDDPKKALEETARVLGPRGLACIADPLAEGSHYRMDRAIDDEAGVRRRAYQAIAAAAALHQQREMTFTHVRLHWSFEAYRDATMRPNPHRRAAFEAGGESLRANFMKHGRETDAGWEFDQPIRVNLLAKGRAGQAP